MTQWREAVAVRIGSLVMGGGGPVVIQTMLKQPTRDPERLAERIQRLVRITPGDLAESERALLEQAGEWEEFCQLGEARCDLVRLGMPDQEAVETMRGLVPLSPLPLVADIHFRGELALGAVQAGVAKIRINPGNLRDQKLLAELVAACVERGVTIRVGVNAGSLQADLAELYQQRPAEALATSALRGVEQLEALGARRLVISVKANNAVETVEANQFLAERTRWPLHLGVTEAGVGLAAMIHSWVGVGLLLRGGIGDTVRISLTESPELEVVCATLLCHHYGRMKDKG